MIGFDRSTVSPLQFHRYTQHTVGRRVLRTHVDEHRTVVGLRSDGLYLVIDIGGCQRSLFGDAQHGVGRPADGRGRRGAHRPSTALNCTGIAPMA